MPIYTPLVRLFGKGPRGQAYTPIGAILFARRPLIASLLFFVTAQHDIEEDDDVGAPAIYGDDAEFGGRRARLDLERGLLRKIDGRMSMLIVIYILNYVRKTRIVFRRC
jgi:hypothetical protein